MNFSNKSDPKRVLSERQESSRVLLICVYDTIALQVTNQLIYDKYSKFGTISKILIFEKGQVTKLFVQYNHKECAQQAKINLDGTKLLEAICKMSIYFSNFSNVDLRNITTQGADFTYHEQFKQQYLQKYDNLAKSVEQNQESNHEMIMEQAFQIFPTGRSKTDNPRRLEDEIKKFNTGYPQEMINEQEQIESYINSGINSLLVDNRSANSIQSTKKQPTIDSQNNFSQRINTSIKIKEQNFSKSSILSFDLQYSDIKIKHMYNLFSNFGNISFINKKQKKVYIKFRTMEFSAIASSYLNQHYLLGNYLKLTPVTQQEAFPREGQHCETIFYDETFDRFTAHRSLTVNSPSNTLHISSIRKDICRQNALWKIFDEYGKVDGVRILCYSNQKNMALVKFSHVQDSFNALSELHNKVFNGRKMQISFTKSKI